MNLSQQAARFAHIYGDLFPVVTDQSKPTTFVYEQDFKIGNSASSSLVLALGSDKDQIADLIPLEMALVIAFWNGWHRFKKPQGQIIEEVALRYGGISWDVPGIGIDTINSRTATNIFWNTLNTIQLQFKTLMQELTRENVKWSSIPYSTAREYLLRSVEVADVLAIPK